MNATELAAISFNCPKTNLPPLPLLCRNSANLITYLFLDSLALGSQGVLHFIRTEDHFPKKCAISWMRLRPFLVLYQLANKGREPLLASVSL